MIDLQQEKFIEVFSNLPNVAVRGYNKFREVIYWNKASEIIYGYSQEEALGKKLEDLIVPDFMCEDVIRLHGDWITKGIEIPTGELPLQHKNGSTVFVYSSHVMIKDTTDNPEMFCIDIDISELKQTEQELKEALASKEAIFSAMPDLMFELDANGYYHNIWANNPQELAASKKQLLGRTVSEMLPPEAANQVMLALKESDKEGNSFGQQIEIDTPDGKLWFELSASLKDSDDSINHYIMISRNITDRKKLEKELEHLSNHDALTGLYNRRMLEKLLNRDIQRANRYKHSLSLFMLDIDNFKTINDKKGHAVGDFVLEKISKVMMEVIRDTDYVVRYGGEEFIIILPETPLDKAEALAERLRNKIEETLIKPPNEEQFSITVSIGISCFTDKINSFDKLVSSADFAMYIAKDSGRNCVRVS